MFSWHANDFDGGIAVARRASFASRVDVNDHFVEEIEVMDSSKRFAVALFGKVRFSMWSGNDGQGAAQRCFNVLIEMVTMFLFQHLSTVVMTYSEDGKEACRKENLRVVV